MPVVGVLLGQLSERKKPSHVRLSLIEVQPIMLPPFGKAQKLYGRVEVLEEARHMLKSMDERIDRGLLRAVKIEAVRR